MSKGTLCEPNAPALRGSIEVHGWPASSKTWLERSLGNLRGGWIPGACQGQGRCFSAYNFRAWSQGAVRNTDPLEAKNFKWSIFIFTGLIRCMWHVINCTYLKIHNLIRFGIYIYMYISTKNNHQNQDNKPTIPIMPQDFFVHSHPAPPLPGNDWLAFAIKVLAFSNVLF